MKCEIRKKRWGYIAQGRGFWAGAINREELIRTVENQSIGQPGQLRPYTPAVRSKPVSYSSENVHLTLPV